MIAICQDYRKNYCDKTITSGKLIAGQYENILKIFTNIIVDIIYRCIFNFYL